MVYVTCVESSRYPCSKVRHSIKQVFIVTNNNFRGGMYYHFNLDSFRHKYCIIYIYILDARI